MYFVFPALLRAIAIVGITSTAPTTQPAPATRPATVAPDALIGKTYRSIVEREVGLGPKGDAMGHWYLRFDSSRTQSPRLVAWDHSDVRSATAYKLTDDGVLKVYSQRTIEARYDLEKDRLLWDGLWYERTK
jgi:hypothetical protein